MLKPGTWQSAGKAQSYTTPDGTATAKQARLTQAQWLWTCDWEGGVQRGRVRTLRSLTMKYFPSHRHSDAHLRPHCWGFSDIWASTSPSRNNFSLPNWRRNSLAIVSISNFYMKHQQEAGKNKKFWKSTKEKPQRITRFLSTQTV